MVAATLDPAASDRLLQVVADARERLGVPALQVAVVQGGELVWTGAVGWADPPARRPVTAEDRFHIGSVSKLYTAALILRLAEEGMLSLDDPVSRFVPDMPDGDRITVRQLLNHTSGLANYTENMGFNLKTVLLRRRWSVEELLEVIRQQAPRSATGTEHYYSNSNYVLLGRIAEAAGGRPFADLLHDEVLGPLELTNTFVTAGERESAGHRAGVRCDGSGHRPDGDQAGHGAVQGAVGDLGLRRRRRDGQRRRRGPVHLRPLGRAGCWRIPHSSPC